MSRGEIAMADTILLLSFSHEDGVDDLLRDITTLSNIKQPPERAVLSDGAVSRQCG